MDKSFLIIEKRFLKTLDENYIDIKEIWLEQKFISNTMGFLRNDRSDLLKIKEPLPFVSISKNAMAFDFSKIKELKRSTVNILKRIYKKKRASLYMFKYLNKAGYELDVSPLKMSMVYMDKGSKMSSSGYTLMRDGDYCKGQPFINHVESDLLRTKGVDLYFRLLLGESPRKIKIKQKENVIKHLKNEKRHPISASVFKITKDNIDYFFEGDDVFPKMKKIRNGDDAVLEVYYRSGALKTKIFLSGFDGEFGRLVPKEGVGTEMFDLSGNKIKESYYKKNQYHSRYGYIYTDNTTSIGNIFRAIDSNYNGVITENYQKDLLKLIVYNSKTTQHLLSNLKKNYNLNHVDFDNKEDFIEMIKINLTM